MGVRGQRHAPAALPPGKYPVLTVQDAEVDSTIGRLQAIGREWLLQWPGYGLRVRGTAVQFLADVRDFTIMCTVLLTIAGKNTYTVVQHSLFYQIVVKHGVKVTVLKFHCSLAEQTWWAKKFGWQPLDCNVTRFIIIRKTAKKSDYYLRLVRAFVCQCAWNNPAPTGLIFTKFDIRIF